MIYVNKLNIIGCNIHMENYTLQSDIGIDIDGKMRVLFKKGIELPIKDQYIIELNIHEPILYFYQGQSIFVENNKQIGQLKLLNNELGMFELNCEISHNEFKIFINEYTETFSFINEEYGNTNEEEDHIRELELCKYNYINYINQTINTLNQIKDKINIRLFDKVKRALNIIYVEDVTIQEYGLAQQEIENLVNPIFNALPSAASCL